MNFRLGSRRLPLNVRMAVEKFAVESYSREIFDTGQNFIMKSPITLAERILWKIVFAAVGLVMVLKRKRTLREFQKREEIFVRQVELKNHLGSLAQETRDGKRSSMGL